jgi:hypothetical protein
MSNRNTRHRNQQDSTPFEKMRHGRKTEINREYKKREQGFSSFRCIKCALMVSADHELSGVNNRNHCPNCLYSRHVDLVKAGDRKAGCGARMQPIGLTVKHTGKKYGSPSQGELMIIHRCSGCGKVSINRVAADDSAGALLALYKRSQNMEAALLESLAVMDIQPLRAADLTTVYSQLFGWQSILGEFTPPVELLDIQQKALTANDANLGELH